MKPYELAPSGLRTADRLAQINMRPHDLLTARASMRQAELFVDMLVRANDALRHVFGFIGRCIGALARRIKVTPVTPTWRAP